MTLALWRDIIETTTPVSAYRTYKPVGPPKCALIVRVPFWFARAIRRLIAIEHELTPHREDMNTPKFEVVRR